MKTRIMNRLWNILWVTLMTTALAQLYYVHTELKYHCDMLGSQVKCQTDQFQALVAASSLRTHRNAQKIAELEASLKALTTGKDRSN